MKIHLTSAYDFSATDNFGPKWLKDNSDSKGLSLLTEDPHSADCILFVENHPGHDPYFFSVLRSRIYKKFRNKCILYHDADLSVTSMPTLSPSIERWQIGHRGKKKSAHYIARLCENDIINASAPDYTASRRYLCSFIGSSRTHPVRKQLLSSTLKDAYLLDTQQLRAWEMTPGKKWEYEAEYHSVSVASHFILCPRGIGPCTYRLFETMQQGRVPVIISDEWVEIEGVDWQEFSIRIGENEIDRIPALLQARVDDSVRMGRMAREAWERNFSPASSLRTLATAAISLLERRYSGLDWLSDKSQFLAPYHFRGLLRHYRTRLKASLAR